MAADPAPYHAPAKAAVAVPDTRYSDFNGHEFNTIDLAGTAPQVRESSETTLPFLAVPLSSCQRLMPFAGGAAVHRIPCSNHRLSSSMMALITSYAFACGAAVARPCLPDAGRQAGQRLPRRRRKRRDETLPRYPVEGG